MLRRLGREGVTDVLVVPLSFVSDHIETLYEVDMLFAEAAREAGIVHYRRTEALNASPLFIARARRTGRGPPAQGPSRRPAPDADPAAPRHRRP